MPAQRHVCRSLRSNACDLIELRIVDAEQVVAVGIGGKQIAVYLPPGIAGKTKGLQLFKVRAVFLRRCVVILDIVGIQIRPIHQIVAGLPVLRNGSEALRRPRSGQRREDREGVSLFTGNHIAQLLCNIRKIARQSHRAGNAVNLQGTVHKQRTVFPGKRPVGVPDQNLPPGTRLQIRHHGGSKAEPLRDGIPDILRGAFRLGTVDRVDNLKVAVLRGKDLHGRVALTGIGIFVRQRQPAVLRFADRQQLLYGKRIQGIICGNNHRLTVRNPYGKSVLRHALPDLRRGFKRGLPQEDHRTAVLSDQRIGACLQGHAAKDTDPRLQFRHRIPQARTCPERIDQPSDRFPVPNQRHACILLCGCLRCSGVRLLWFAGAGRGRRQTQQHRPRRNA